MSRAPGFRIASIAFVLIGLLSGISGAGIAGAQPVPTGTPTAFIELRVHSCPDDFAGTGFYQHQTQCTSERSLYGVGIGVQSGGSEAAFQYSQPDDTGRADLMRWGGVTPGPVTITEVAPDPVKPSVAFCSLQPMGAAPLTMDGEEVPVVDGVMTLALNAGDTLMCDWYRFPGGVSAGDAGDGNNGDAGGAQGADRDGDGLLDDDEALVYRTDPDNPDTDGDGTSDGAEVYFNTDPLVANEAATRVDTDADGLYDDDEVQIYQTDPAQFDTDADGIGDGEEVGRNSDPRVADGDPPGDGDTGTGGDTGAALDANCLDPEEATVLTMLNDLRALSGAPPVQVSGTLNAAAEAHSQDMITRNYFDHLNPDGQDPRARILAAGYVEGSTSRFAENIDRPRETGREVFDYWEGGDEEYRTMVDSELVAIGIARVELAESPRGWYWTTTFANQLDAAPNC